MFLSGVLSIFFNASWITCGSLFDDVFLISLVKYLENMANKCKKSDRRFYVFKLFMNMPETELNSFSIKYVAFKLC